MYNGVFEAFNENGGVMNVLVSRRSLRLNICFFENRMIYICKGYISRFALKISGCSMHLSRGSPLYPLSELGSDTLLRGSAPKDPIRTGDCACERDSCTVLPIISRNIYSLRTAQKCGYAAIDIYRLNQKFSFLQLRPKKYCNGIYAVHYVLLVHGK